MCVCCMNGWIWQQKKSRLNLSTLYLHRSSPCHGTNTHANTARYRFPSTFHMPTRFTWLYPTSVPLTFSACQQMLCPKRILLIRWKITEATSFDRFLTLRIHTQIHTLSYLNFSRSHISLPFIQLGTELHYGQVLISVVCLFLLFAAFLRFFNRWLVGWSFFFSSIFFISVQARLSQFVSLTHHSSRYPTSPRWFTRFK